MEEMEEQNLENHKNNKKVLKIVCLLNKSNYMVCHLYDNSGTLGSRFYSMAIHVAKVHPAVNPPNLPLVEAIKH